jgi:hypothetical protein
MVDDIKVPDWVEDGAVTLKYTELRPSAIAEIVRCLAARNPVDTRVFALRNLCRSIAGEPLE